MLVDNMEKPEFRAELKKVFLEALKEFSFPLNKFIKDDSEEYSDMKQVTKHFHVTKPTIYTWIDKELVFPYKFGGRVLYKIKEIEDKLLSAIGKDTFGKGRDYHKKVLLSQDEKDFVRYKSLNSYQLLGKTLTDEDIIFYKKYCEEKNMKNNLE